MPTTERALTTAQNALLEAALDQRRPSKALKRAVNELLRLKRHPLNVPRPVGRPRWTPSEEV